MLLLCGTLHARTGSRLPGLHFTVPCRSSGHLAYPYLQARAVRSMLRLLPQPLECTKQVSHYPFITLPSLAYPYLQARAVRGHAAAAV